LAAHVVDQRLRDPVGWESKFHPLLRHRVAPLRAISR
jgi:hypothetical protein